MIEPSVLILGSRYDLTCDFVVAAMRQRGVCYIRLNSEDLAGMEVSLSPEHRRVVVQMADQRFCLASPTLKSILYRRPVFLRDYGASPDAPVDNFQRHQWSAFTRNMMILDKSHWMNHPRATYSAEHKAVQLASAHEVGFDVPDTMVSNSLACLDAIVNINDYVVVKGLDTVLVRQGDTETFGYTNIVSRASLSQDCVQMAPVIFQQALRKKLDLRVTVVGPDIFAVSITEGGKPIEGDWRRRKNAVEFKHFDLPEVIKRRCYQLITQLNLTYGAIDLAAVGQRYYFLEVNPTGEWAWLVDAAGLRIDQSVADRLIDTSWIQP